MTKWTLFAALTIAITICPLLNLDAQLTDTGLNYQAVIRQNGQIISNQTVSVRFTIIQGNNEVFTETHQTTTTDHGLVNLVIGNEKPSLFANIKWGQSKADLKVEVDSGSGFIDMGSMPFQSVPYAKIATDMKLEDLGGINFNTNPNEGDVFIFEGGEWTSGSEGQTLELNGTTLTITGGNSINLNEITTGGDGWGTQTVESDQTITGDGTSSAPLSLAPQGANEGEVLTFSGGNWTPAVNPIGATYTAGNGISINGSNVISNNGDLSTTNEIQSLSINGNTISLSEGGGSVNIPIGSNGDITGVTAGTGLTGGGVSGGVTLNAQTNQALWNANKIQGIDVNISAPEFGQVLAYDGTNFINSFQLDGDFIPNLQIPGALAALASVQFPVGGDVIPSDVSGYVVVGNIFGTHLAMDNNEIMAKSAEDAAGNLFIQNDGGGRVAVGSAGSNPSHLLHVFGVARSTQSTWATSSDVRVKENIQPIENAISKIEKFNPVTFDYKPSYKKDHPGFKDHVYGFIAQEVETIVPEMVSQVNETVGGKEVSDFRILSNDALIPLLVKGMKEQQEIIESLQARLHLLENLLTVQHQSQSQSEK